MKYTIIFSFLTALGIVLFITPHIINIAHLKNLFDEPSERKVHKHKIPRLGGFGVAIAFMFTTLFFMQASLLPTWNYILCAVLVIFSVGFKDDIVGLSPSKKLTAQITAAFIIIYFADIQIRSFYGIFGIYELPVWFSYVFTIFTMIVITNAFNLIDGINGLLGLIGCITSLTFGFLFYALNLPQFSLLAITVTGALIGFLYYNITPAKVFMGDAGSLVLGFLMSVFAVKLIDTHQHYNVREAFVTIQAAPALAAAILSVPLFDTLRVFFIRVLNKKSPFSADRSHIHHLLIDAGFSHLTATLILGLFNIFIITVAIIGQSLGNTILIFMLLAILLVATFILIRFKKSVQQADKQVNMPAHTPINVSAVVAKPHKPKTREKALH
jgi:UDP-N-acetylmuramyl pentapeptide phosphotransferase/UDP-N-acetylglucosamine-1-phosphate transferase